LNNQQQREFESACWNKPPNGIVARMKYPTKYISLFSEQEMEALNEVVKKLTEAELHSRAIDKFYYTGIIANCKKICLADKTTEIVLQIKIKETNDVIESTDYKSSDSKFYAQLESYVKRKNLIEKVENKMIKKVIEYEAPPELMRGKLNMGHGKFINLKVTMSTVEVLDQLKVTPYNGITIISESRLVSEDLAEFGIEKGNYSNFVWIHGTYDFPSFTPNNN
jgi:hypothetical protein